MGHEILQDHGRNKIRARLGAELRRTRYERIEPISYVGDSMNILCTRRRQSLEFSEHLSLLLSLDIRTAGDGTLSTDEFNLEEYITEQGQGLSSKHICENGKQDGNIITVS